MKVGGKRVVLIRSEMLLAHGATLGGVQPATQVAIRVELLEAK